MEPDPCRIFACPFRQIRDISWCEKERCAFAYIRHREEDRVARDRRDRIEGRVAMKVATR